MGPTRVGGERHLRDRVDPVLKVLNDISPADSPIPPTCLAEQGAPAVVIPSASEAPNIFTSSPKPMIIKIGGEGDLPVPPFFAAASVI